MSAHICVRSFAKINLYLDVLPKRPDGYHDIETIFQTVDLYDELTIAHENHGLMLSCSDPALDCGGSNLILRAAELLRDVAGCAEGARMHLSKHVPVSAGLAGGSGNAAAALVGLNALWELGLGNAELEALALQLGSDVPYCLNGGTMSATGRGEVMSAIAPLPQTWFVLVHPGLQVSTPEVYGSPLLRKNEEPRANGKTTSFISALSALSRGELPRAVFNRMEDVVYAAHPHLQQIKQDLVDAGCTVACMSGSGPTLFGVSPTEAHAREVASKLSAHRTSVVTSIAKGVEIIEQD